MFIGIVFAPEARANYVTMINHLHSIQYYILRFFYIREVKLFSSALNKNKSGKELEKRRRNLISFSAEMKEKMKGKGTTIVVDNPNL